MIWKNVCQNQNRLYYVNCRKRNDKRNKNLDKKLKYQKPQKADRISEIHKTMTVCQIFIRIVLFNQLKDIDVNAGQ